MPPQILLDRLRRLYPDCSIEALAGKVNELAARHQTPPVTSPRWSQRDAVLITYGDQVRAESGPALPALTRFLKRHGLQDALSIVHLLPFFPYTSDDGFSVVDYRQVDPAIGDWSDVEELHRDFDLMFDLVLNHCSQQHAWFRQFLAGDVAKRSAFHVLPAQTDVSQVTRPRSTPLLTPFQLAEGQTAHVWTTFSDDQIDWNFADPAVLLEMLDVLLTYVQGGARIIRLDAIAYLWKKLGTPCIHLPETHEVVKLMRDLVDWLAPRVILLTETNVPHRENVSYFGDNDEAHMVYQFSLAPLLLDALLNEDASLLNAWLHDLQPCGEGQAYLNFTASHDGVGVRPLEGIASPERMERLARAVLERGGRVSTRRQSDGSDSPYELNISYFAALDEPQGLPAHLHVRRFLGSQSLMLALRGVPAVYFQSLVGGGNDLVGLERTGRNRSINRRKYGEAELEAELKREKPASVFAGYVQLLRQRANHPAFHPDALPGDSRTGAQSGRRPPSSPRLGAMRCSPAQLHRKRADRGLGRWASDPGALRLPVDLGDRSPRLMSHGWFPRLRCASPWAGLGPPPWGLVAGPRFLGALHDPRLWSCTALRCGTASPYFPDPRRD